MEPLYIHEDTHDERTEGELRADNPNTCFPLPFYPPDGWHALTAEPQPEYSPMTQRLARLPAVQGEEGWQHGWQVVELTPEEARAVKKALVPASVSRKQARQALLLAGKLDEVDGLIAAIEDPLARRMAELDLADATHFDRHHGLVLSMATGLGLSEDQLDDLFIQAGAL